MTEDPGLGVRIFCRFCIKIFLIKESFLASSSLHIEHGSARSQLPWKHVIWLQLRRVKCELDVVFGSGLSFRFFGCSYSNMTKINHRCFSK